MCKRLMYPILFLLTFGLAQVHAQEIQWIKAAYWDARYPTAWGGGGDATRDALRAAGYEILDADQLKTWMNARIADKKYSVVVFCRDVVPDTVVESQSATCTLRKYLNAGGKIVWYADIPFYYWGHATGVSDTWGDAGAPAVLGFNTSSAPRDSGSTATITPMGAKWGLTATWTSQRPLAPSVTTSVTILARDNNGNAPAWVKHYVTGDRFRGFVRIRDTGGEPLAADIIRVAEYASFKADTPTPADGTIGVTSPLLTWEAGAGATFHDVYFGTTPELTAANLTMPPHVPYLFYYHMPLLQPGVTYYWRVDEFEANGTVHTGDVWSFTAATATAFAPVPRNGDKWVDPNTDLSWKAGMNAIKHEVYFSTEEAAVANRAAAALKSPANYAALTLALDKLAPETTYYWAVDEDTGAVKSPGQVWKFTTNGPGVTGGVKGEYYANTNKNMLGALALTRTDPAINFTWGDAGPDTAVGTDHFSARWTADLEIAAADTYTFITTSDDGVRLRLGEQLIVDSWIDQGTTDHASAPLALEPGIYPLTMEFYEWEGGAVAQLSWQTPSVPRAIIPAGPLQPPLRARAVYPADGDVNIPQDVTLTWSAGDKATAHQVYLGEDAEAVANATPADAGLYQGQQPAEETSFLADSLDWNKTYYWRVDEIGAGGPWKGAVWSFTTADFIVVDDFESYNDLEDQGTRIYETWLDGLTNGTTSFVGHWDPPFAEPTIVHGGNQSMPLDYNNINSPYYAEAEREWTTAQNWTVNGTTALSLWIRGDAPSYVEDPVGQYTVSANSGDIWGNADTFRYVYKTLNGDGSISAKVISMTNTSAWAKAGVMIRDTLDPASSYAFMFPTPEGRRAFQNRPATAAGAVSAHSSTNQATLPFWVKVERKASTFTAYYSTDGTNWIKQPDTENTGGDRSPNPQTIPMGGSVCIGLAVASNNGQAGTCMAVFSDVVVTGSVSAQFQMTAVGVIGRANDRAPLYVILQDSANKKAVVVNPDPGAVNVLQWTEWRIPFSDLSGISLNKVKKMYLGVGAQANRVPDGGGLLFIDDIRVVK